MWVGSFGGLSVGVLGILFLLPQTWCGMNHLKLCNNAVILAVLLLGGVSNGLVFGLLWHSAGGSLYSEFPVNPRVACSGERSTILS